MAIEKVHAGQLFKPRAATHNKFVDAARKVDSLSRASSTFSADVLIENTSGSDLSQYAVLGIDGTTIPHTDNSVEFLSRITLEGDTPALASHAGNFAVLLEPAKNGQFARCIMSGLVQVQVDIQDADHEWCDIEDSETANLISYGAASARIVHKPSGTGVKWCLVNLAQSYGPAPRYRGLVKGAFADTATTFSMDNLVPLDGVGVESPLTTTTKTVQNKHGWRGDDNAVARMEFCADTLKWEGYMEDCPS